LDENFPKTVANQSSLAKHEIIDIRETGKTGLDDSAIFKLAQEHKAIFLTTDMDFFHTIPFHYPQHYGVIIIALNQPNRERILEKIEWCLENIDLTDITNKVILLKDNSYTIKK
jgi:predicted nuclease of predicted toxin-antitoxin system